MRRFGAGDQAQQRRFSRTGRSEESQQFAGANLQANVMTAVKSPNCLEILRTSILIAALREYPPVPLSFSSPQASPRRSGSTAKPPKISAQSYIRCRVSRLGVGACRSLREYGLRPLTRLQTRPWRARCKELLRTTNSSDIRQRNGEASSPGAVSQHQCGLFFVAALCLHKRDMQPAPQMGR